MRPTAVGALLSCRLNRPYVTVRVLHVFSLVCSRSISGSLRLQWRISDGASPLLGQGEQSVLVDARCDLVQQSPRCGGILPPTQALACNVRAVGAPSAERRRICVNVRKICRNCVGKDRNGSKRASSRSGPRGPGAYRYGARTDSGPIALRAFWSMHVEAMNWSGMGHAEYAAALGLSPHALRIWRDRLEESGYEMDWRSLLHPSARAQLSSAANCARRKYRLTPQPVDGRSNRRSFSDEQKRAIVQETEKPGVSVAQVCRRHGIATSMLFRWRVEFGLNAERRRNW